VAALEWKTEMEEIKRRKGMTSIASGKGSHQEYIETGSWMMALDFYEDETSFSSPLSTSKFPVKDFDIIYILSSKMWEETAYCFHWVRS
jgi:hypothetical protein